MCVHSYSGLPFVSPFTGGMQPQIGIPPGGPVPMDRGPGIHFRHSELFVYDYSLDVAVTIVYILPYTFVSHYKH